MDMVLEVWASWGIAGLCLVCVLLMMGYGVVWAVYADTRAKTELSPVEVWGGLAVVAFLWWSLAGGFAPANMVPVIAASLFGISLGTLAGFIFTAYSEEAASLGRVRDLLLAALATATVAEAATGLERVKSVLGWFSNSSNPASHGAAAASIVVFAVVGFVGSFILRELTLNIQFARARNERKRLETVLVDILTPLKDFASSQAEHLSRIEDGEPPSAEVQSRAGEIVTLFRVSKRSIEELERAESLAIAQCYAICGLHPAAIAQFVRHLERFGFDRAAVVGAALSYEEIGGQRQAALLIERYQSELRDLADQWLGYYLLWMPSRIDEAIRRSEEYLKKNPDDPATTLNRLCGLSQRYAVSGDPQHRDAALSEIERILPGFEPLRARLRELSTWNDDFFVLRNEERFVAQTR